jgi:hypothetical protein
MTMEEVGIKLDRSANAVRKAYAQGLLPCKIYKPPPGNVERGYKVAVARGRIPANMERARRYVPEIDALIAARAASLPSPPPAQAQIPLEEAIDKIINGDGSGEH